MPVFNGKDMLFYANATSEPALPDEITNYTLVGQVQAWSFTDTSERLTSSNKDNGARITTLPGDQSYTISCTVEWDKADNAGQDILFDALQTTTSANKLVYWLATSNVTNDLQLRGSAYLVNGELNVDNNAISTMSFEMSGNGAYTKEAVDA